MHQQTLNSSQLGELLLERLKDSPDCMRLIHGRGKAYAGLESINIEWYRPYIFVQSFGDNLPSECESALKFVFENHLTVEAVLVQSREWPDFVTKTLYSRTAETDLPVIFDASLAEDLRCEIKLGANRNTGLFLDMRSGWHWVKQNSREKRVLNLFCYTGVFSLFALHGGARHVDNVDMAANVLRIAQRNHQINNLHQGQVAFYKRDILKSQRWFESREKYDLLILDPPPYQKKAFRGWQDYMKLLSYCLHALAEGGTLLCSLNNPQVSIDEFEHDLLAFFGDQSKVERVARAPEIEELDQTKGLKLVAITP